MFDISLKSVSPSVVLNLDTFSGLKHDILVLFFGGARLIEGRKF